MRQYMESLPFHLPPFSFQLSPITYQVPEAERRGISNRPYRLVIPLPLRSFL